VPREFDIVLEHDSEGDYAALRPQMAGCRTQLRSLDEVTVRIPEAIELCLEVEAAPGEELEFVGIQRVTTPGMSRSLRVTGQDLIERAADSPS
jgi:predicted RNase H-like HicB family nuclease